MDIINLDSSNFVGLSSRYKEDETLKFNQDIIFSEQSIHLSLNNILKEINDNKINNYSNLFLTNKGLLTSSFSIENLEPLYDEGFSTYIAANAAGTITPSTKFWVVEEPGIAVNVAQVTVDGEFTNINNQYFFDVELITEKLCKISHENENIIRYLTVDYTGNLSFTKDIQLDSIGALSPQIFYYVYDRAYNYIVLIKNINDIPKFVTYNANANDLTLTDPITGTSVPYSISSIFRVRERNPSPNKTELFDPWLSYNKNFKTNSQDINPDRSFVDVNANFLLNNEYFTLSSNSIDFNVLSLKNTSTPEYNASRANPFFDESNVEFRDYQKMNTGSYQNLGNDNISLGFESYTNGIILKKDKVTYFHIPQVFYPFERLNINDSNLVNAGAIAGDHPIKADKIFKKKANYKYTSNFGNTAEENSGEFLCSWLSGSIDPTTSPFWVDRYYNPKKVSAYQALTASDFKAIKYISNFDCLVDKAFETFAKDVPVFDKPSDLIFEKGTYYAYHHYGPNDVDKFIKTLSKNLIVKNIPIYRFYNGSDATYYSTVISDTGVSEYIFDGSTYGSTTSLSAIQESNQFTLVFDAYSSNWQAPLGYQLVGNYDRDGFGIFNENLITPTLFLPFLSGTYVTNLEYTNLNTLAFNSNLRGIIRLQGMNDFYGIFEDNSFRRFNLNYSETRRGYPSDVTDELGKVRGLDYNETEARVLIGDVIGAKKLMRLDLNSHEITDITTGSLNLSRYPRRVARGLSINTANSLVLYNDTMYLTQGTKAVRANDTIFYNYEDTQILQWRNITDITSVTPITAFVSSTIINDFSIDFDSNIWVLFDYNKFIKFSYDRVFLLSGAFTDTADKNYTNFKIDFTANFDRGDYNTYAVITRQSYTGEKKNLQFVKMTLSGDVLDRSIFNKNIPLGNNYIIQQYIDGSVFSTSTTLSSKYASGLGVGRIIPTKDFTTIVTFDPSLATSATYVSNNTINFSNSNFLATYVKDKYPANSINVKSQLTNIFNINDTSLAEIIFDLSLLDPGYHNFAVRFDADNGRMHLFVDGQLQGYTEFTPRKYKFSNLINRPFLIGCSSYAFSLPLFSYLKNSSFIASDFKIKDFYLYDKPLFDFDILFHARKGMKIHDIVFDVACGRRNYTEEVERYFKLNPPGSKSTKYNLIIKNSGIQDEDLQYALGQRIYNIINNTAPAYTKLNTIKWIG